METAASVSRQGTVLLHSPTRGQKAGALAANGRYRKPRGWLRLFGRDDQRAKEFFEEQGRSDFKSL